MSRGPFKFGEAIGQKRIVKLLKRNLDHAKLRQEVIPPTGLIGPSGSGKTALAKHLAQAMNLPFKSMIISTRTKLHDLMEFFKSLDYFDMVLLDEAHNLGEDLQELLYQIYDTWSFEELQRNKGANGKVISEKIIVANVAAVNLFLATDQPGRFKKALHRRMDLNPLDPYDADEIKAIILGQEAKIQLSAQAAKILARVSKENPGEAVKYLRKLQVWVDPTQLQISEADVREFLTECGVDLEHGLDSLDQQYLGLIESMPSASVTINHLSSHLKYDTAYISKCVEPFLQRKGYIVITSAGRKLTDKAKQYLENKHANQSRAGTDEGINVVIQSEPTTTVDRAPRPGQERDPETDDRGLEN